MKCCPLGVCRSSPFILSVLIPMTIAAAVVTTWGCGDGPESPDKTTQHFQPADPEPESGADGVSVDRRSLDPPGATTATTNTPTSAPAIPGQVATRPAAEHPLPPQPNTDKASVERAEALLQAVGAFYAQAQSIQVDSEFAVQQEIGGNAQKISQERKFSVEKPNKWIIATEGGPSSVDMISDGKTLVQFNRKQNSYLEMPAPESLDVLFADSAQGPAASQLLSQATMFFGNLVAEDPYRALRQHTTQIGYLGQEDVAGKKAHRLVLSSKIFRSDLWISTEPDPLILKVDSDLSLAIQSLAPPRANPDETLAAGAVRMTVSESFHHWRINQQLPAETFVFKPPPGAQKIDPSALGGAPPDAGPQVGEEAPEIAGEDLDGIPFKLSDYRGKVVMLTFWGDW